MHPGEKLNETDLWFLKDEIDNFNTNTTTTKARWQQKFDSMRIENPNLTKNVLDDNKDNTTEKLKIRCKNQF